MTSKLPFQFSSVDNRASAQNVPDQNLPDYMKVIVGDFPPTTQANLATQNVLELNLAMMGIYDNALKKYQKTFLAQHPVILALFTGQGGKLTLYSPGMAPLHAPSVPVHYQVYKSVSHACMAVFELAGSHLGTVSDRSWVAPMRGDNASGLILGFGLAATIPLRGAQFVALDVGYQVGWQAVAVGVVDVDLATRFLHLGVGLGTYL